MKQLKGYLLALSAVLLAGCGGGGGGGSAASSHVRMFVTDDLGNYDHVWVSIKEVDIQGASGNQVVFADPAGRTVDLASLNKAGTAQFAFLGQKAVPSGTYTQVKFVFADSLVLFPAGSATGQTRTFAGSVNGSKTLTLTLEAGEHVAGDDNLVADFDLLQWVDDGSTVTATVKRFNGTGLDDGARHEADDFHGTISGLTGSSPNFTFNLSQAGGSPLQVQTDSTTAIFNNDGSTNPVLANGERVEVRGIFSVTANSLIVTSIKIEREQEAGEASELHGTVVSVGASSFVMTAHEAEGFLPTDATVTVAVDANTRFTSHGGVTLTEAEFLAALSAGQSVEVKGAYDSGTNTLQASRAKLEDGEGGGGGHDGHEAEVKGLTTNPDAGAATFDITVQSWEGASLSAGQVVHVITSGSTQFKSHGNQLTASQFFASLTGTDNVEVKGDLQGSTLAATDVKIDN